MIGRDRVLERILLLIVKIQYDKKEAKASEVGTTENELRYSIPGISNKN